MTPRGLKSLDSTIEKLYSCMALLSFSFKRNDITSNGNQLAATMSFVWLIFIFFQVRISSFVIFIILFFSNLTLGQDKGFMGYASSHIKSDGSIITQTYGHRNAEKNQAYDSLTIQSVASVSKIVVGLSLMKAQELGLLDLDTDVNQYLDFTLVNPHFTRGLTF